AFPALPKLQGPQLCLDLRLLLIGDRNPYRPGQNLDCHSWNDAAVLPTVFVLERVDKDSRIAFRHRPGRDRHREFMALSDISHEGDARLIEGAAKGGRRHDSPGSLTHFRKNPVDGLRIERVEPHVEAAYQLVGN